MRISVEAKTFKEIKVFQESKHIFQINKDCEAKFIQAVKQANENVIGGKLKLLLCAILEMLDE